MMQSIFIDTEYSESQEIRLEKITTLKVQNLGNTAVYVCGILLMPMQTETIIQADGTFSNLLLDIKFNDDFKEKTTVVVAEDDEDDGNHPKSASFNPPKINPKPKNEAKIKLAEAAMKLAVSYGFLVNSIKNKIKVTYKKII